MMCLMFFRRFYREKDENDEGQFPHFLPRLRALFELLQRTKFAARHYQSLSAKLRAVLQVL